MDSFQGEGPADVSTGRDRTRARIVEVAAGLLATGGRDAVSTRAVALAAGTQAPTIYRLFGDKEGLLDAVAEYGFASYLARKPVPQAAADPVEDLRADWDLHISFGLDNPALFLLMYGEPRPEHTPPAAAAAFTVLQARIRSIAAAGRLRVSERLAADMVHAAGCGTVITLLATPEPLRTPDLSAAMFDAVVAAIATVGPGPQAPGPVPAANALRAEIPGLTMLSPGERHVLQEWLDRIVSAQP
jgi:AcrR family transcriptional regulator